MPDTFLRTQLDVHHCALASPTDTKPPPPTSLRQRLRLFLSVSEKNHRSQIYLRSNTAIQLERLRHTSSRYWFIIHPFSLMRVYWEMWMVLLYSVSMVLQPYQSAFQAVFQAKHALKNGKSTHTIYVTTLAVFITDILCMLDVFFTFVTGVHIKRTHLVLLQPSVIFKYYARRWLIFDLMSSISCDYIIIALCGMELYADITIVPNMLLNVQHYIKFLRLRTMSTYFYRFCEQHSVSIVKYKITLYLFVYFIIIHWGACITTNTRPIYYIEYMNYMEYMAFLPLLNISREMARTEQDMVRFLDKGPLHQYLMAIHQTLTNIIGFGQPSTVLGVEDRAVTLLVSFVGRGYWVVLLVIICQILSLTHASQTKYVEMMDQVKQFSRRIELPRETERRLMYFFKYRFQNHYFREKTVLSSMSSHLQNEIALNTCRRLVENVPVLKGLEPALVAVTVSALKSEMYLATDVILEAGEVGDCMYFILSGTVAVFTPEGKEVGHLHDGDHFGEMALLLKSHRQATVVALEASELYRLSNNDLHPEVSRRLKSVAKQRYQFLNSVNNFKKEKSDDASFTSSSSATTGTHPYHSY